MARPKEDFIKRFWNKVDFQNSLDKCWLWKGCYTSNGYGQFGYNGEMVNAHRFVYEVANSIKIPKKMVICHSCDNRLCVNPFHLFIGTYKQNTLDAIVKNRLKKTKITVSEAKKIKQRYLEECKTYGFFSKVGREYGVSHQTIRRIVYNIERDYCW